MKQNRQPNNTKTKPIKRTENEKSNVQKDPEDWVTGNEPMTGAQESYLNTLSSEAGEEADSDLAKAEASKKIEELQQRTGRGLNNKGS